LCIQGNHTVSNRTQGQLCSLPFDGHIVFHLALALQQNAHPQQCEADDRHRCQSVEDQQDHDDPARTFSQRPIA
jgi:hypothetical protein